MTKKWRIVKIITMDLVKTIMMCAIVYFVAYGWLYHYELFLKVIADMSMIETHQDVINDSKYVKIINLALIIVLGYVIFSWSESLKSLDLFRRDNDATSQQRHDTSSING